MFFAAADAPCIGICYHNKLMALEGADPDVSEDDLEFSRGWPLNAAEFDKPCVGLCYYFRSLGMDNPYDTTNSDSNDDDNSDDNNDDTE